MKYVILSRKQIPGYSVKGPILTPAEYDIHQVLKWVVVGIDVREVMEDGSYRKLSFNDPRLMEELDKKLNIQRERREHAERKNDAIRAKKCLIFINIMYNCCTKFINIILESCPPISNIVLTSGIIEVVPTA